VVLVLVWASMMSLFSTVVLITHIKALHVGVAPALNVPSFAPSYAELELVDFVSDPLACCGVAPALNAQSFAPSYAELELVDVVSDPLACCGGVAPALNVSSFAPSYPELELVNFESDPLACCVGVALALDASSFDILPALIKPAQGKGRRRGDRSRSGAIEPHMTQRASFLVYKIARAFKSPIILYNSYFLSESS
jgi:hypothetical protein